ncbi:hypothetical protein CEQ90_04135 [Lewinellaceae bacterium SD302]|nr:hypothetical protein CEQ90_04135 [Lewinellaceae bacterium SD302]
MRFIKSTTTLILILSFLFAFTACGKNPNQAESKSGTETTTPHGEGQEYTSVYVCPMHCDGSGSDHAGECPVCGMTYVAQADHRENGHKH